MKKNILLIIFYLLSISLFAQITVTNSTFPQIGDTLRTAIDGDPNISLESAGENITWDFSSLEGPTFENIYLAPSEGTSLDTFPSATHLTGQPPINEIYFQQTTSTFISLGFAGQDPIGLGLDVVFKNNPPLVERNAPLNYNDDHNSNSDVRVAFAWDELPSEITDSIGGGLPITPDSIAILVETSRQDDVDAWGTVILPSDEYDVLRVKRLNITETKVEAYLPIFGGTWQDVTDLLSAIIPAGPGGESLLGKDTTLTYRFYNDQSKEEIAVITADPVDETPTNARYKATDGTTSVIKLYKSKPSIYAYPNPAIDKVRFDVVNLPKGKYDLNIYNILGVKVWSQNYQFYNSTDTIQLNVSDFNKGTYLYSLVNNNGKTLATRRLVILRP